MLVGQNKPFQSVGILPTCFSIFVTSSRSYSTDELMGLLKTILVAALVGAFRQFPVGFCIGLLPFYDKLFNNMWGHCTI